jgi:signal transduction histidine kinase
VITWISFRHSSSVIVTRRPEVATLIAGAEAIAAVLAAYVSFLGFAVRGERVDYLAGAGFSTLAGCGVIPLSQQSLSDAGRHVSAADVACALLLVSAAGFFLAAGLVSSRTLRARRRSAIVIVVSGAVSAIAILTAWSMDSVIRDGNHTAASLLSMAGGLLALGAAGVWWRLPDERSAIPGMSYLTGILGFAGIEYAVHPPQPGVTGLQDTVALLFAAATLFAVARRVAQDSWNLAAYSTELQGVRALTAQTAEADVATLAKYIARTVGDLLDAEVHVLTDDVDGDQRGLARDDPAMLASEGSLSGSRVVVAVERSEDGNISVGVPLATHGRRLGTLVAARPASLGFAAAEVELLGVCGAQASLLLERSILREEVAAGAVIEERSRLAREVHDGLAQHLAFLKMRIAWLRRSPVALDVGQLDDVEQVLETALQEARQAITTLRAEPQGTSTAEAIAAYAAEFGQISGMSVEVSHEAGVPEVGPKARVEVLRIVQEALNNARTHAGASHVAVRIRARGRGVEVTIIDDGTGFDTARREAGHFGIEIMRERAESIGGHFDLTSTPDSGTRVRVWVPALEAPGGSGRRAG